MMTMKTLFPALGLLMALSACGAKEKTKEALETTQLQGSYQTDCKENPVLIQVLTGLASDAIKSTRQTLEVEGTSMDRIKHYYADTGCALEMGRLTYDGSFDVGETVPGTTARALDITIHKATFTLTTPQAVDTFNKFKVCDVDHWKINEPIDITGRECIFGKIPPAETTHLASYREEDQTLYMTDFDCSEGEPGCRTVTTAEAPPTERNTDLKVIYHEKR